MFLNFSKTLKKMSGFRIGKHVRLKGWSLLVFGIFILMFYIMYWSVVASLWMIYGICYLCYLPFKLIFKRKNKTASNSTDKPEPIKNPVYYVVGGTSYHKKRSCVGSETVRVVSLSTAEGVLGLHPCGRCCKK